MKKIIIALIAVALLSCEKEVKNNTPEPTTHVVEIKFNPSLPHSKKAWVNGEQKESLIFSVQTGDLIEVEAVNHCWYNSTGIQCDNYNVKLFLDGVQVAQHSCYCQYLTLEYTVW